MSSRRDLNVLSTNPFSAGFTRPLFSVNNAHLFKLWHVTRCTTSTPSLARFMGICEQPPQISWVIPVRGCPECIHSPCFPPVCRLDLAFGFLRVVFLCQACSLRHVSLTSRHGVCTCTKTSNVRDRRPTRPSRLPLTLARPSGSK